MILLFQEAFRKAFEDCWSSIIWTNDRALKTSAMQSHIYPALARILNLWLIYEHPADAAFYPGHAVAECKIKGIGCPSEADATILLEHEIVPCGSDHETRCLLEWAAPLSVLIVYFEGSKNEQITWANCFFGNQLQHLAAHKDFLLICPMQNDVNEINIPRWNFMKWSAANCRFESSI